MFCFPLFILDNGRGSTVTDENGGRFAGAAEDATGLAKLATASEDTIIDGEVLLVLASTSFVNVLYLCQVH